MQGERQDQSEFTIERSREKVTGTDRSAARTASSVPHGEHRAGQAEFDLGDAGMRQPDSGMPERLRRKYYVAEAGSGDEAKVYADPRGEYLAFKVSTDRIATRLEDAGVVRDMVSVTQHRGWNEVELRGSAEFRRTAWLEASVRGLSVRGFEPDPVDRAALAFRAKPNARSTSVAEHTQTREAGASETVTVDGIATRRPIDVTVMPPDSRERRFPSREYRPDADAPRSWKIAREPAVAVAWKARDHSSKQPPTVSVESAIWDGVTSRNPQRDRLRARADELRTSDARQVTGDEAVKSAQSQLVAIERALTKAIRDFALRQSVLSYAKERIAEELERGRTFERKQVRQYAQGHQRIAGTPAMGDSFRKPATRRYQDIDR